MSMRLVIGLVSIHAPREGRDSEASWSTTMDRVSIHAPREGRDTSPSANDRTQTAFQSTRPVKGATVPGGSIVLECGGFNPRAP